LEADLVERTIAAYDPQAPLLMAFLVPLQPDAHGVRGRVLKPELVHGTLNGLKGYVEPNTELQPVDATIPT